MGAPCVHEPGSLGLNLSLVPCLSAHVSLLFQMDVSHLWIE